ncbi:alkaline phosphatase D family protein [Oligoflexus tunisiensis]|uniref:alkaline phosphatase D family protein n=1 Tax=Oligoflexus tunisiensis TaxID=708132 RepID=UPI000AD35BC8|nr:alkaline phosphatase D family protein [Oligoflexus tunisiensis]
MQRKLGLFLFVSLLAGLNLGLTACKSTLVSSEPSQVARDTKVDSNIFGGRFPLLQTVTDDSSAQFNILLPKGSSYRFSVKTGKGQDLAVSLLQSVSRPHSDQTIDRLKVKGLNPKETYQLLVHDENGTLLDEREFSALDTHSNSLTFAFSSCQLDDPPFLATQAAIYAKLSHSKPDLIILGGDTIYVDTFAIFPPGGPKPTEADIWTRYVSTWSKLSLYRLKRLIPTLATWDDHDFGSNDAAADFPYKNEGTAAFQAFFQGQEIPGVHEHGPGVATSYDMAGQRFIFMDNRSFRIRQGSMERYAHWGESQEQWLLEKLNASSKPTWIVEGNQFFGLHHAKGSFQRDHPENFRKFMDSLQAARSPVALLSGDLHFTEVQAISFTPEAPPTSYEFTFSPWHSRPAKSSLYDTQNSRRLAKVNKPNFGLFKTLVRDQTLSLKVEAYGPEQDEAYFVLDALEISK